MDYEGKYRIFDAGRVRAYPLSTRANKVTVADIVVPAEVEGHDVELPDGIRGDIEAIAEAVVSSRKAGRPVVLFTGAHLIKNGLGPLLIELVGRGVVTLMAGNAATAIHDFELALVGKTSENVPDALGRGRFGMAHEFAYINTAISLGNKRKLGFGESLGKMVCDAGFRREVLASAANDDSPRVFSHPEVSVLAACYSNGVPFTVHAGIGTDVTDQHPSFDGEAKGGCSGRDFLIYANDIAGFVGGGVILNIGSAVTGPEVLLKAVSMAANIGKAPKGIITADFDLRDYKPDSMSDEQVQGYYFRDQKSVVTRIPAAFAGKGYYVRGDQKQTFVLLYKEVVKRL